MRDPKSSKHVAEINKSIADSGSPLDKVLKLFIEVFDCTPGEYIQNHKQGYSMGSCKTEYRTLLQIDPENHTRNYKNRPEFNLQVT